MQRMVQSVLGYLGGVEVDACIAVYLEVEQSVGVHAGTVRRATGRVNWAAVAKQMLDVNVWAVVPEREASAMTLGEKPPEVAVTLKNCTLKPAVQLFTDTLLHGASPGRIEAGLMT